MTANDVRKQLRDVGRQPARAASMWELCLSADAYTKIPIRAGQRYSVTAEMSKSCDVRGWTCDNWGTRSGPEGVPGYYVAGSLGHPVATIGTLIGAFSGNDAGASLTEAEAEEIFRSKSLQVGLHAVGIAPIDGYLYLIFNDTWTGGNQGSVHVEVWVS
jgi:hypothetical protein